jgi:hypothetical protein
MLYAVIGDVHGCAEEFSNILDLIDKQFPTAIKIQVGDLIHKGPDSAAAVQIAMERTNIVCMGNHEEKHLRWLAWERSGKPHTMRGVEDWSKIRLSVEQEDFLAYKTVLYFQDPQDRLLVVHGGVSSSIRSLPDNPVWSQIPNHERKYIKPLLFTRYQNPLGHAVSLGDEQPGDIFWANAYDGRFGTAVYGHQAYDAQATPQTHLHALGVDLGCVYGNKLCAAIFSNGTHAETITVDAKTPYRSHGEYSYVIA